MMEHILFTCLVQKLVTDYDYYISDGVAKTAEMTYCSVQDDYGKGKNYIPSLKPGESVQVNMAWIVNEKDLENLYLNLNGYRRLL